PEDGIRYLTVTGVQTCALPIWRLPRQLLPLLVIPSFHLFWAWQCLQRTTASEVLTATRRSGRLAPLSPLPQLLSRYQAAAAHSRSEERRVGRCGRLVWDRGAWR